MEKIKLNNNTSHIIFNEQISDDWKVRSEEAIFKSFIEGHEGAFSFIYNIYFDRLTSYGQRFCKDSQLTEDIIQELFIELRKNRLNLPEVTTVKGYIFKCFRRKLNKALSKKKIVFFSNDYLQSEYHFTLSSDLQYIKKQLTEEQRKYIEKLINKLPKRQKEALYHFYFENMSYAEVAEVMQLRNIKSARNLIYTALSILKPKAKKNRPAWLLNSISLFL